MVRRTAIGSVILAFAWVAFGAATSGIDRGVRLSDDQAANVVGGQTSTHNYKGNSSNNVCTGSTYPMCGTNNCDTTIVPAVLAGQGTRDFVSKQPCGKRTCNGLPVSCGSETITSCT